jgi:gamma-tubulin complex component 2
MLETWIHNGLIDDPYGEFMVQENKDIIHHESSLEQEFNDKFWSRRYILQRNNTPILFQSSSEMILNTGKYLNAIRESAFDYNDDMNMDMSTSILRIDKQLLMNNHKNLEYTIHEKDLDETLEEAYKYASEILLDLILNKYHLIERFQTLKHYFLIDKGDYIVQFMDSAEDELTKRARDIDENKIQSLLDVSLAITSDDQYKDDVRIKMFHYDLISMLERVISTESNINESIEIKLTGLESFSLDYDVKWPISLVINRNCLTRYQMLFRFLFYIKYIERLLCNVWRAHKNCGRRRRRGGGGSREKKNLLTKPNGAAYLRHKMLHFVQNLLYYMSFEVIESHWHTFQNNLKKVFLLNTN